MLHTPAQPSGVVVELLDWSLRGARLRVPNELDPRLAVGAMASLTVAHPDGACVRLDGRLVQRSDEPAARVLVLRFTTRDAAGWLLQPHLAALFDRRGSFRVAPSPAEPVTVTLIAADPVRPTYEVGVVLDVSTGGLGVEVSGAFERAMAGHAALDCLLTLPSGQPLTLRGRVVHRVVRPSERVRYGVSFDPVSDRRAYEAILAYVVRRQAELVRAPGPDESARV